MVGKELSFYIYLLVLTNIKLAYLLFYLYVPTLETVLLDFRNILITLIQSENKI